MRHTLRKAFLTTTAALAALNAGRGQVVASVPAHPTQQMTSGEQQGPVRWEEAICLDETMPQYQKYRIIEVLDSIAAQPEMQPILQNLKQMHQPERITLVLDDSNGHHYNAHIKTISINMKDVVLPFAKGNGGVGYSNLESVLAHEIYHAQQPLVEAEAKALAALPRWASHRSHLLKDLCYEYQEIQERTHSAPQDDFMLQRVQKTFEAQTNDGKHAKEAYAAVVEWIKIKVEKAQQRIHLEEEASHNAEPPFYADGKERGHYLFGLAYLRNKPKQEWLTMEQLYGLQQETDFISHWAAKHCNLIDFNITNAEFKTFTAAQGKQAALNRIYELYGIDPEHSFAFVDIQPIQPKTSFKERLKENIPTDESKSLKR